MSLGCFQILVRRAHLHVTRYPSTPSLFASSRHVSLSAPASRPFFGPPIWSSGGSLAGRQVHIPHTRNRPLAASKFAAGYNSCCITIRAGEAANLALANCSRYLYAKTPPLGLKFSQIQRTIRSYVVQLHAQAKLVFPT